MNSSRVRLSTFEPPGKPDADQPDRRTGERLFDIAAALFCEKGYAATTTREIATAAGIQQASLYYHVAGKEDLLHQICVSSLEQLFADVQSAVGAVHDPVERIEVLVRTHLRTILRHQIRHVTMLNELRALSDPHRATIMALRKNYAGLVRSVLEAAQAEGAVRTDIPARYLYLALLNILNWAVLWFRRGQTLSEDQIARIFTSIYLTGAASRAASVPMAVSNFRASRRKSPAADGPAEESRPTTFERLLDAAATLFARKGYAAASTREIAGILGIRKASLYYHIENKEDLLYAICKTSLDQIRRDVAAELGEVEAEKVSDPVERIRTLIRAHIKNLVRGQIAHSVAVGEMHALSGARLKEVIALRDAYEELVRSVLEDARKAGALRDDISVKYLCLLLLGLLNRVEMWYRPDGALSPEQLARMFEAIFLTGAAARPAAP
jgi:TetR/AcrR family transcriptional regulator, cholesterol catabolism regulator